ncbi:hypothetical protein ABTH30_22100, partial [Acinetobacter baumannii]
YIPFLENPPNAYALKKEELGKSLANPVILKKAARTPGIFLLLSGKKSPFPLTIFTPTAPASAC